MGWLMAHGLPWRLSDRVRLPMQQMWAQSLGQEDPLEEEAAAHSSVLAWRIHGQRGLFGCSPWGRRVGHDCMMERAQPTGAQLSPPEGSLRGLTAGVEKGAGISGPRGGGEAWAPPPLPASSSPAARRAPASFQPPLLPEAGLLGFARSQDQQA